MHYHAITDLKIGSAVYHKDYKVSIPATHSSQRDTQDLVASRTNIRQILVEVASYFGFTLSALIVFLAPEITSNDAGELAAAAYELGIAHPPGFPVFMFIENIFMNSLSVGEFGFRANFSSAVMGALALTMSFWIVRSRGVERPIAWATGLFTLFSPLFTVHAVTVEVYASAALIVLLSVECLLRYLETNDQRYAFALAVILGLGGLAHHPVIRLVGVCFAPFVLARSGLKTGLKLFVVSAVTGLLVTCYLPLRSSGLPDRDWGSPRTMTSFIDHLSAQRIRASYEDQIGQLNMEIWNLVLDQLMWSSSVFCLLALIGIFWIKKSRPLGVLMVLFGMDVGYAVLINPMGVVDYQNGWLSTVVLFPIAAIVLTKLIGASKLRWWGITSLVCLLSAHQVYRYHQNEGFSGASPWYESMTRLYSVAPADTLLLTASDSASSMSAYLQVVESTRPDIASVVRQHAFRSSSTGPVYRRRPKALAGWQPGATLTDLTHLRSTWPVIWEWADDRDATSRPPLDQRAYPFYGRQVPHIPSKLSHWLRGSPDGGWSQYGDFVRAQGLAESSYAVSKSKLGSPMLKPIIKWAKKDQLLQHRYTAHLTREGHLAEAEFATLNALKLIPADGQLMEQLIRIYLGQKRYEIALSVMDTLQPTKPNLRANLFGLRAVALANLGHYQKAIMACEQALTINPNQVEANVVLPRLRSRIQP